MSVATDLPLPLAVDVTPSLQDAARAHKGTRFVATGFRRLFDWRAFLSIIGDAPPPPSTQPKLLSHSGHGCVAILTSDVPLGRSASPALARTTIRRICGASSLRDFPIGRRSPSCPKCGLPADAPDALERHVARCPNWGARHLMHRGLSNTLHRIIEESGVPKAAIVEETRGLRPGDANRLGDTVVLDFSAEGRNLIFDGVVTNAYRNYIMTGDVVMPGYARPK